MLPVSWVTYPTYFCQLIVGHCVLRWGVVYSLRNKGRVRTFIKHPLFFRLNANTPQKWCWAIPAWEDGSPRLGRNWDGVRPVLASGSLSPCSPAGCVQGPGALAPKRLTAHSCPAESQGEGRLVTMPGVGGHRPWPGRVLLPGMVLISWVGGWAGGAEL